MGTQLARRLARPSWRDPRLGVGIILVAVAVALGVTVVGGANRTTPVYAAAHALTPGESLDGAVVEIDVAPAVADRYLAAGSDLDGVVDRVIGEGELIPASAVVASADENLRSVVVPVGTALPPGVAAGTRVDVWLAPSQSVTTSDVPPALIVENVVVEEVLAEDSSFVASGFGSVALLVPTDSLGGLLSAMGADGDIVVVPRAGL